jgi:transcriptional regulator with PAS, ATPase and Fis domain
MSDLEKILGDDDFLSQLIDALPCGVLIINELGQIVAFNNVIEHIFNAEDAKVIGKGFGKALCCINSCDDRNECGSAGGCDHCEIRKLAMMALHSNQKKRGRVSLQVNFNHHIKDVTFLICASPLKFRRNRLGILTIEDITNLKSILPPSNDEGFRGIISKDDKMKTLCETIKQISQTDAPVLIQGESGTGKELVALAIHKESQSAQGRFVAVNCGALPQGLLESELFGHVKGAFTGALNDKKGRFELADNGTIFLDEVAELSPEMQVKFLRVLQDGSYERVGATKSQKVNVRVISATNVNLEKAVAHGKFRRDLYYRLCVIPVTIPPLRERPADIELLANYFLKEFGAASYYTNVKLSPETILIFKSHDWPGNCRELQNVIQFALVKCQGEEIKPEHLPATIFANKNYEFVRPRRPSKLNEKLVIEALQKAGGNKRRAAEFLGVSRSTLYRFFDKQKENSNPS